MNPLARIQPFDSPLAAYEAQAEELLTAFAAGDEAAAALAHQQLPRFRDAKVGWLARPLSRKEVLAAGLTAEEARLAVARHHCFRDWTALADYAAAACERASAVHRFEAAVEAVVTGDVAALDARLKRHPELIRARSVRVTPFDPAVHRAMLLHYLGANGVEGYRQRTPANAVEVARVLLEAGAEVDATASLYGGECTTLSLLVSSAHPAQAGLQGALAEVLIDYGAALRPTGAGHWTSPLATALAFGYRETAEVLVRRGAPVDSLDMAAGVGRLNAARELLPCAGEGTRHRALALAAQMGHAEVVALLLEAGEDPNRFNPPGLHAHSTPLHQAALAGHLAVVKMLAERGARLDRRDTIWDGTPLGWARHGGQQAVAAFLESMGAPD